MTRCTSWHGRHKWGQWDINQAKEHKLVIDICGVRRPDEDFTLEYPVQVRRCLRCGQWQKERV